MTTTSFVHAGNVGDLIWQIPTIAALAKDQQACLFLKADVLAGYAQANHPCGKVRMTVDFALSVAELLRTQALFASVELWTPDTRVDYDLDQFRKSAFPLDRGHNALWIATAFPVQPRTWEPWLKVDAPRNDLILINRTSRYRNPRINYTFLTHRHDLRFVGLEAEWQDFCQSYGQVEWLETHNHLELARAISGCRLFIGNQSTAYAIAEGLGVPRIQEVSPNSPVAFPLGPGGWMAWDNRIFRRIIAQLVP